MTVAGIAVRAVSPAKPHDTECEDRDLLAAVAGGDRQAYETLYHRHAPILLGLLARIFGERSEAEDVLQEVFLQIWRRAGDFDERRGRVLPWLAAVARNRALDRLRMRQSREHLRAARNADSLPEESRDPVEEASLSEDARRVHRALEEIPEPQRRVLLLAYFEGLTQSEIAERLGAPLGTVKSHARTGLMRLRDVLRCAAVDHLPNRR